MYISIAEAQGQLLDLIRRAQEGEEVLLTHEGKTVATLGAVAPAEKGWREMTPEERLAKLREFSAKLPPLNDGGPDAAHSQDFLYDENGLPA